jgi:hypothetical protein
MQLASSMINLIGLGVIQLPGRFELSGVVITYAATDRSMFSYALQRTSICQFISIGWFWNFHFVIRLMSYPQDHWFVNYTVNYLLLPSRNSCYNSYD